jgi:3-deoxy-manno-octulosonate cytidylyltransferase (CMP-KDO synthetase)
MVDWVYERARMSPLLDRLTLASNSDPILIHCAEKEIPVVQTSAHHTSGTSRLVEVMNQERLNGAIADIYVNIQGDEPMVAPGHIESLLKPFLDALSTCDPNSSTELRITNGEPFARRDPHRPEISTLRVPISSNTASDPNVVKVVTDSRDRALYFSRAPIPYDRDATGCARYYKHLGFYAYTTQALRRFESMLPSPLEQIEQLEQLRFLENGIPITVPETTEDTIGVDTEADLRRVEEYFRRAGIAK